MSRPQFLAFALAVLAAATPAARARAATITYDARSGELPEASGWSYVNTGAAAPPVVTGGVLLPHATNLAEFRYWARTDQVLHFVTGFTLEIVMEVLQSNYDSDVGDGTRRSGFYLEAVDSTGHRLTLGIAGSGVTLNTDAILTPTNGIPFVPFGATNGLHRFRVVVEADSAVLTLDGVRRGACALGPPAFASGNTMYFGDGSGAGTSDVRIQSVGVGSGSTTAAGQAPAAAPRLSIAAAAGVVRGRADFLLHAAGPGSAQVRILDAAGRRVADLGAHVTGPAGSRVHWDGRAASGHTAPPGLYWATATAAGVRAGARFVLLR